MIFLVLILTTCFCVPVCLTDWTCCAIVEVGHVAAVVSAIVHTVDEDWLALATRPSFSEMLGELGTPPCLTWGKRLCT